MLAEVQMGREVSGDLPIAESREWLVTNGLGGFAMGTVAGTATRRYHALLMAALQPPVRRTLLVNGIDEIVRYRDAVYSLATNRWKSGFVSPRGHLQIESFYLEGSKPVWRYALTDALVEKRVWMKQGENTTYVQYSLLRGAAPIELEGKVLVNYRDFHSATHAKDWRMDIEAVEQGLRVKAFEDAVPFYLKSSAGNWSPQHEWYREYFLPEEQARGLDDNEDRLYAGLFQCTLRLGETVTMVFSTEASTSLDGEQSRTEQSHHELKLFQDWQTQHGRVSAANAEDEPSWLWQLVLAADQFLVERTFPDQTKGKSVIAGYPWFSDWGRDTMIVLPGLTLSLGRAQIARDTLRTFARFADGGLLPNTFPDTGGPPQYNTIDATLWFFEAVRQYFEATKDVDFIRELFPKLGAMIEAHVNGTSFNIKVDPADGLLAGGAEGVQLTWMDAKVGDWVVTPRTGKPVEINALWINALHTMAVFAATVQQPRDSYERLADKATSSFQNFWNVERDCCYDVIDTPRGEKDASLRPNQIFAVSLPVSPLAPSQQRGVVDAVAQQLLTSMGLRSLGPQEPGFKGICVGDQRQRDSAYHQGTVWGWLLGPFALAHYRVYGDAAMAQSFLEPLGKTIYSGGLGTLGEVFGGDAPFLPAGCPAQAWTVAEVFRAWQFLSAQMAPVKLAATQKG